MTGKTCALTDSDGAYISCNEWGPARKFKVGRKAARVAARQLGLKNVATSKGARAAAGNIADRYVFDKFTTARMCAKNSVRVRNIRFPGEKPANIRILSEYDSRRLRRPVGRVMGAR